MVRKYKSTDRFLIPDVRSKSLTVAKFINCIMRKGKKSIAEKIFFNAMDEIHKKVPDKEPLEIFTAAINNVKPQIEVRSRRVGGATYQVPMEVSRKRQNSLAMRWMLDAVRSRKGKPTYLKLADEILSAYNKEGTAITKRENVHKMAEANRAFAHLAWRRR